MAQAVGMPLLPAFPHRLRACLFAVLSGRGQSLYCAVSSQIFTITSMAFSIDCTGTNS